MNSLHSTRKQTILAGSIAALALGMSAFGQTNGTWVLSGATGSGNWSATTNWLGGDVANGAMATATFNTDITADATITLDTARTIGNLSFRDTAAGSNGYILAGANVLTLDNGASKPTITVFPRGTANIARIDTVVAGTNGFALVAGTPGSLGFLGLNAVNAFSGAVTVGASTRLRGDVSNALGASDALGIDPALAVNYTEVLSGGAFLINNTAAANAINYGSELFKVQGVGTDGTGAIINISTTAQQNALQQVQMTGDTTFGGTQRWDIRTGAAATGRLYQNGFTLTKTGANQISLVNVTVVGGGNINVNQGILGVEGGTILGGTGELSVNTGGSLNFWSNTGDVTRQIVANGGVINHTNTTTATIASPVRLQANTTIQQAGTGTLNLNGAITESGGGFGIAKTGTGTLNLGGANTFTGLIDVTAGTVAVPASGSLAANNSVNVASGSVFNVSAKPNHTLASGNTLTIGRTGATGANDVVGSIVMSTGSNLEIGTSGRNGGANPVRIATISGALTFNGGSTVYQDLSNTTTIGGGVNDLIAVGGALTLNGVTSINVTPVGGGLAAGNYTLITYGGALTGGPANLALTGIPGGTRQAFAFNTTATPGSVLLAVTGAAANLVWTGGLNANAWDLNTTANWNNGGGADVFKNLDNVTFNASGSNTPAINLTGSLVPGSITVTGTQDYIFGGTGTLDGGALTKSGAGKLTITGTAHTFVSPVQINGGTVSVSAINNAGVAGGLGIGATINLNSGALEFTGASQNINRLFTLGASGGTVSVPNAASRLGTNQLIATGTLTVSGAGSFMVGQNDAAYTYATPTLGTGNLALNPHMAVGSTTSLTVAVDPAALPGFNGKLILAAPASGSWRTSAPGGGGTTQAVLGAASSVIVEGGAQLWVAPNTAISTNATITGIGFIETNGTGIGAIRMDGGTYTGNVNIVGSAAINAHNSIGTVTGNISGGTLLMGGTNFANNMTLVLTGTNTQSATIVNSGGTGTQTSMLQIGTGGTTGTVGSGPVTVNGDTKNGILRFIRSDGYTLASGQTITAGGSNKAKAFLDLDVQGAGFNSNGQAIDFTGGNIRVGVTVADANATLSGVVNAGSIQVGVLNAALPTTNAVLNFATGANVTTTNMNIANGGSGATFGNTAGATVNIAAGTTVAIANNLFLGDQNTSPGFVNQSGGAVTVGGQFRVGHYPNNTSIYSMNGGTLTLNGTPSAFPYTTGATEVSGGIYLGIDGTGVFNQTAGTVSTRFVVLDNRADTAIGIDTYSLDGGELILTNAYGIISRNASTAFNLNGGTLTAGTSFNLDSNRITVLSPSTLNTNGNTITALAPIISFANVTISGNGTFTTGDSATANFAGGGSLGGMPVTINAGSTLRSNRTANDAWFGLIDGAGALVKDGAGDLTLSENNTYTGTTTVNAGSLTITGSLAAASAVTVNGPGVLSGNGSVGGITLNGGGIRPGATAADGDIATLNLASLTVNAGSNLRIDFDPTNTFNDLINVTGTATFAGASTITPIFAGIPVVGSYPILTAGTLTPTVVPTVVSSGGPTRFIFGTSTTATTLSLTVGGGPLAINWTGANGTAWDVNTTVNWKNGATDETFYTYDGTVFASGVTNRDVVIDAGGVTPGSVLVNNDDVNNYTFNGPGAITGGAKLTKQGVGTLTINNSNAYTGGTEIQGGILKIATNNKPLGNGFDVTVASGATLDVNGQTGGTATRRYDVSIAGTGVAGQAAIWNSGGGVVNNPIYRSITLTADASIGGVALARYDVNGGTVDGTGTIFNGGNFTLTKVGANELWWAPVSATVGKIVINEGLFGVQNSFQLGNNDPTYPIVINAAGTLGTYGGQSNDKAIEINGGVLATSNGLNSYLGRVTLTGAGTTNRIAPGNGLQLNLTGQLTGSGGFEKLNTGILELQGFGNDWSGDTKVSAGTLRVSGLGELSPNTTLDMNGGIVDVNFGAQTVAGLKGATGTIQGAGALTINQTADTVYSGSIISAMIITKDGAGSLTLNGVTNFDILTVDGGTLNINTLGTGTSTINANAAVNLGTSQTLAALNIGDGGVVTLVGVAFAPPEGALEAPAAEAFADGGVSSGATVEAVPEPGAASLLVFGALGLLGRHRARQS